MTAILTALLLGAAYAWGYRDGDRRIWSKRRMLADMTDEQITDMIVEVKERAASETGGCSVRAGEPLDRDSEERWG